MIRIVLLAVALAVPATAQAADIHRSVTQAARAHGVPPALAHGVVKVESGYRCNARNRHSTAKGIMQVLDGTARGVGVHGNRLKCQTGLEAGMRYLREAYRKAQGNWCWAATLYNQGTGSRARCNAYGRKVMRFSKHQLDDNGIQG
jgi:soluble lytic murein transglycosylase-like protein